ncbi:6201_t:CDS:2 [Paraglomus occultum]|uniref:6201_t:CDS:1 n=1 Tax=Paraglomus occultum TaxID=144539 RepID=A0A9N9BUK9_9GLOM|nr:6201_t:CDS:2 [Paraglomus occultum]
MSDNNMLQSTNPSPLANASFSEVLDELATHCPLLRQWSNETEKAFAAFLEYKTRVPVCGAVILNANTDKVLLVKGWTSKSGWGFPKGKINKDELDAACAVREVLEETGYDIAGLIKEEDYIELTIREQRMRLYIVVGVPEDASFAPITRKEISRVEWHNLSDLPTWGRNKPSQNKQGTRQYYMVVPFVSKIRSWLARMRKVVEDPGLAEEQETSEVSDNDVPKYTYRRTVATSSSVNGRHITAPRPVAATANAAIAALASSNSTSAYSEQQRRNSLLSLFQQDAPHRSPPRPNTTQWPSENPAVSYSSSDRSTSLLNLLEGGISSSSAQRTTRQDSGASHSLTDGGSLSSLYQDLLTSTGLTTDAKLPFLNNRSVNGHQIQSDTSSINTGSTDFSFDGYNPGITSDNGSSVSSSSDSSSSSFQADVYPLQEGYGLIHARGNDTFAVTGVGMKVGGGQSPWLNFRFDTSKILAAMNRASNSIK